MLHTLVMLAPSRWCQSPVPRLIGGSQEPAAFFSWGTMLCFGYSVIQHRDQQRLSGTASFICRSLGTWLACHQQYHPHMLQNLGWCLKFHPITPAPSTEVVCAHCL
ncbi:hypothetical protein, unlikely [Trypanosoma brucei gambiense DAL972]|uniref:T. brucei spp.-specific protein n=1 Tax=Trypanosoma brucei gambiense (strain MHOM/CI/86/DAL972) TaxID=679716 RepID=C9ZIX4_TRYB9|nr:hypothetical protein, unlikely [Trypanosoma brucei gambiense DAL972]CBH09340.1 hypothetical protein, unlikely [Trypanosoma brucei gambiense DAL972]|eukprot:XP_011771647.1 hypothetical protein, unlikely [Trypanosoma brucei gambiense DAL972]